MDYDQFYKCSIKEIVDIIQEINLSETKFIFTLLGSCQRLSKWILDKEGISKNLIGIYMPYSKEAINEFMQTDTKNYVSEQVTTNLAKTNYLKFNNDKTSINFISTAVSSSLKTNRLKRGKDRSYITIFSGNNIYKYKIDFLSKDYTRSIQDFIISYFVLKQLYLHYYPQLGSNISIDNNFLPDGVKVTNIDKM